MRLNRYGNDASGLDLRADVSYDISVYPFDDAQSSRHPFQTPAEISEARLRIGMDLEAPIPLLF